MYTQQRFPLSGGLTWTKDILFAMAVYAGLMVAAFEYGGASWLKIPALPVTVLGTAVSFYLGFKGNAAYGRLWEARKIWGGIVNTSRTWGIHVTGLINDPGNAHQELIYRHVAWLAALRIRLRRPKPWEHRLPANDARRAHYGTLDTSDEAIRKAIDGFVSDAEADHIVARKNQATQLLHMQSQQLKRLYEAGAMDDFRHMELVQLLETMFTLQGKAERIKNFPLPRQYATANYWFVVAFLILLPLAIMGPFHDMGAYHVWLTVPASMILGWVFMLWNRVLDYSENPFEGLVNDIPMTAMSRGIEIDLREILGETDLPPALGPVDNVQM